jgi:hypothetical protein
VLLAAPLSPNINQSGIYRPCPADNQKACGFTSYLWMFLARRDRCDVTFVDNAAKAGMSGGPLANSSALRFVPSPS